MANFMYKDEPEGRMIDIGPMVLITPEEIWERKKDQVRQEEKREARKARFPTDDEIEQRLRQHYAGVLEGEDLDKLIRLQLQRKSRFITWGP